MVSIEPPQALLDASKRLQFDSEFESGNLEAALYEV